MFYLNADDQGKTRKERLQARLDRAERRGKTEEAEKLSQQLAMPPFPEALGYLWAAFNRLRTRKASGFNGPSPIEWPDIDAFLRRSGMRLAPWEIELIEEIDDIYLNQHSTAEKKENEPVSVDNAEGVKALMSGMGPRRVVTRGCKQG